MEILGTILGRNVLFVSLLLYVSVIAQQDRTIQIETVADCYALLDNLLEQPGPTKAKTFKNQLAFWQPQQEEGQLAKVVSLCNLGHIESQFYQFPDAISSYEKAKQLFPKEAKDRYDIIEFCLKPLGTLYTKTNALEEAENLILEYILLANRDKLIHHEIAGLKNLSVVYQNKGSFQSAISVLQQGLKLSPNENGLLLNLATNYRSVGNYEEAGKIVDILLASDKLKSKVLQLKASIELEQGLQQKALQTLQHALVALENDDSVDRRQVAKLLLSMAQLEVGMSNVTKALGHIQNIYSLLIPSYSEISEVPDTAELFPENTLMDTLDLHALILEGEHKREKALRVYEMAFRVSELLDGPAVLQESKILHQSNWKHRSEKCLELLYTLYATDSTVKWIEQSFKYETSSKSRIVRDQQDWRDQLLRNDTSEVAILLRKTQKEIAQVSSQINELTSIDSETTASLLRLQSRYNMLISRQRDYSNRFQEQYGNDEKQAGVSLSALQEIAERQQQTVVSYFVGSKAIYQWVISSNGFSYHKIAANKSELNDIMQYYVRMSSYFESSKEIANAPLVFAEASNVLYEALQVPKVERLVIIPDGMFGYIPFGALTTEVTETMNFQEMPFLIYETEINYSLSLADYLDISEENRSSPEVLGVFPVFRNTPRSLLYSLQEAEGISDVVTSHFLMDQEATTDQFLNKQEEYNTLHISTHARGGSFTRPAAIEFNDRLLTVNELYGYNLGQDLVVLSACETGVGKVIKGEGAMSIARAFQYAGAENMLFSLWKVNDLSTAKLMIEFYNSLSQNGSYSNAIHQSQLSYLRDSKIDNAKKSPYYWAAFVYYGDSKIGETSFPRKYIYLVIGIVILVLIVNALKRRKRLA